MTKLQLRKIFTSVWGGLLTLALVVGVRMVDPSFVESVRLRYFDTLITNKPQTANNLWVVNIDEAAIDHHGQWPFARGVYADLIKQLYEKNAGLVVFGVLMSEQDRQKQDDKLAAVIQELPTILVSVPSNISKNTAKKPGAVVINDDYLSEVVNYPGIIANIPLLETSAWGVGIANQLPELDGVNRRVPLVVAVNDNLYPHVSLETLRILAQDRAFQVRLNAQGVEALRVPKFGAIPTDSWGRIWIDWSQGYQKASMMNLPDDFEGAVVIVGTSAAGVTNPVSTSLGARFPQDVQAAVIATLVNQVSIARPDYADAAEIMATVITAGFLMLMSRWLYVGIVCMVGLLAATVSGSMWAYASASVLLDVTFPGMSIVLVGLHVYVLKFMSELFQKQQIKKQFGSYVSPVIVERLQKNPNLIRLGGEEKQLTAVMTDMRNFTGLGEKYGADVEGFTKIMNEYMTAISKPVFANDGCLIKFIGDASLHIHGAPLDDDRHAYHAVKTTIEMIQAVEQFNQKLEADNKPRVGMGAGVNTGKILVGNIGSEGKMGYDVLGDPVSVASRLESQTKAYGVLVILGPDTYQEIKDDFFCLELDCIAVKGKTVGLNIYTPLLKTPHEHLQKYHLSRNKHNLMMQLYRSQKFTAAQDVCNQLMGEFDQQMAEYYQIWIKRCQQMQTQDLPADWDGIYQATSK